MKLVLLLFTLTYSLFGAKILSYNVYDRSDRVDIMFTFDTPFEGNIRQITQDEKIVIKLNNTSIESAKIKSINSPFLTKLTILPLQSETQVIAKVPSGIVFKASKTSDAYGLRLRFQKKALTVLETQKTKTSQSLLPLPTKNETEISTSYIIIMIILFVLSGFLFFVRKRLGVSQKNSSSSPWLFNKKSTKDNVSIKFQKAIDTKNKVIMLEYQDSSYLVVVGTSNIILDKFENDEVVTSQSDFETMLQSRNSELDSFLQIDQNANNQDGFNRYKENASTI